MRLPKTLVLLLAAARAQELERIRLEFLVAHLHDTMANVWDAAGTVTELIETSVPDHEADLAGGAEALRKALFASLRMLKEEGRVYMMYAGFDVDGTFCGYYGAGQSTRSTSDGDYFYTLLRGWDCAWHYVNTCSESCVGDCVADVSVPCVDGYKGSNPDCRRYYDVSSETGVPASCTSAVSCITYFDDHYNQAVYDPRMRPWYTNVNAATPRAWSNIYAFASEGMLGITAAWRFANSGGGVVGLDLKLGSIRQIVADAYAAADGTFTPAYVRESDGLLVAASDASVSLVDGDGNPVTARNCSSAAIRAGEAYLETAVPFTGRADAILEIEGVPHWLFRGAVSDAYGLDWTVIALHRAACRAGYGLRGSACAPCPKGAASAENEPYCDVRAHHYRFVENAAEVYACPAHDDACRGQRGDNGAGDALCARRATGPLCMRCQRGHHRVVTRNGRARCKRCGDWRSIAGVYVYLVVFVGLALIWLTWARKALAREVRTLADRLRARSRLQGFDRALPTLWIVARQAIYAITVMSQVRSIERLSLPRPYSHLMDALTAFAIDIDKYLGPLACFELGYYEQLLFWTLLPPILLIIAVSLTVASVSLHQYIQRHRLTSKFKRQDEFRRTSRPSLQEASRRAWEAVRTQINAVVAFRANTHDKAPIQEYKEWTLADALQRVVTGWVILCIYLHSFICGVIYKAFVCARPHQGEKFLTSRGERAFLRADYGLVCGTQKHTAYVLYATLALIVYGTFPAILALRLYVNRKDGKPDKYLGFMVSHLRPGAWALECVAMWYRMILSGALWLFFRRDDDVVRLGLCVVFVILFVASISFLRPYATEGKRQACTMIQHSLLIFFCLAIAVKGELFSPKRFALFGTLAFVATLGLAAGVAWHVWRADVRALVDGLHAHKLDRLALRRLYEGAEKAVIGEAILEAALIPIEGGIESNEERWEFVEQELFGSHGATRDVLRDVWDDPCTEDLEPWLGAVRAQASRKLWAETDSTMTVEAFASDVDEAAPWLRAWLRPFVERAYAQVSGEESLKCCDALLAFDLAVVHALGGECTVDQLRKKLHGMAHQASDKKHAWSFAHSKVAPASSFSDALRRASRTILHQHDDPYAFVKPEQPPLCSRYTVLAIRAKALALQSDDAMAQIARAALDDDAGLKLVERGSVGLDMNVEQPSLTDASLAAYVKTLGGASLRDRVDADALPDVLHDLAGCAHASFRGALEAIVKACPGSSLLGGCASERAVKSVSRMRAKVHEYRAEEGSKWPACARVQDPLRATILCQDSAVMLAALKQVESKPFKLLRLKNNLASEKKPFNLHAVLEYATPAVGVPLVVEVQLLFDDLLPLFEHTHNLYSVYRARSFAERHT